MIGIYKITSKDTGKCYIGQSIDILNRWKQHICKAKYENENTKFYNALRKYGYENFNYEIIEECDKKQSILDERERYWIAYYNSYEEGYNSTRGGQNQAWIYNPETIQKMWDAGFTTGEIKDILGCSASLIRERLQGYKDFNTFTSHQRSCGQVAGFRKFMQVTEEQIKYFGTPIEVHQYSLLGEYIASYPSIDAAAKAINKLYPDTIGRCFRSNNPYKTAYGYQWSKEKVECMPPVNKPHGKLVYCITTDMYFSSIVDAAKWAGIKSKSNIRECCNGSGRYKSAGKHPITGEKLQWKYVENMS